MRFPDKYNKNTKEHIDVKMLTIKLEKYEISVLRSPQALR